MRRVLKNISPHFLHVAQEGFFGTRKKILPYTAPDIKVIVVSDFFLVFIPYQTFSFEVHDPEV